MMCGLTVVGAQLRIPLPYVPITLQTFFVILSGMVLGPIYGAMSQIAYLLLGIAGLPVFSQGGGVGYIFKPTFGYLLGYPLASAVVGRLIHGAHGNCAPRESRTGRLVLAGALGIMTIFIPGVLVLYLNLNFISGAPIALSAALWSGFVIFLPGDALKLAGVIVVYRALQRFM
jgi:biotin transport system substrate-specific component